MSFKSYLIHLFNNKYSEMNNDFFLVFIPVLILTVLMFSLRAILLGAEESKFRRQS